MRLKINTIGLSGTALAFAALGSHLALAQTPANAAAQAKPMDCAKFTTQTLGLKGTIITSATPATGKTDVAACVIRGATDARIGVDGKHYALDFEMRLPSHWNGRFLHQVNGGNDGAVVSAEGGGDMLNALGGTSALARGFAVLSSDEGHNGKDPANASWHLGQGTAFGIDPQARDAYGYTGDAALGPVGKAVVSRFYGVAPATSYMMGCSNGGRHAMVAASRFPDRYNGFIAGDPGFDLPRAALQHAWDEQSFMLANKDVQKAFSPADLALVSHKVVEVCDKLDGVADGIVGDIRACQKKFHLGSLQCTGAKTDQCLAPAQVTALNRAFGGPKNSKGQQLYSDWSFDSGLDGRNWRFWKLYSGIPPWGNNSLIAVMGSASLASIFTTPPTPTSGTPAALVNFLAHFNFDTDAPKIYAKGTFTVNGKTITYPDSAWTFMTPPHVDNPHLAGLSASGHKLLIYQGQSDPVFSFNSIARWYGHLDANDHGKADQFARLFAVPGMNHCAGGPATDGFDALEAMVNWAENGVAPKELIAHVRPDNKEVPANWSPKRTRPLCPWPKIARYKGGDVESAASFACQ